MKKIVKIGLIVLSFILIGSGTFYVTQLLNIFTKWSLGIFGKSAESSLIYIVPLAIVLTILISIGLIVGFRKVKRLF